MNHKAIVLRSSLTELCREKLQLESDMDLIKIKYDAIISERDQLKAENEELNREISDCAATLPGVTYMDPPDGGSPTIAEQLSRMAKDAARYRFLKNLPDDEYLIERLECATDPENWDSSIDRAMSNEP